MLKDRLAAARKRAGLTQEALGDRLKPPVTRVAVSQWESGITSPSHANLKQAAEALRVTVHWLLTGEEPPPRSVAIAADELALPARLVKAAVHSLEEYLNSEDLELDPATKAETIIALCQWAIDDNYAGQETLDLRRITPLLRLHRKRTAGDSH